MFRSIAAASILITSLLTAVSAAPAPGDSFPPDLPNPLNNAGMPNVALFSLPASITPPAPATLHWVFQGYGTQNYTCNTTTLTFSAGTNTASAKFLDVTKYFVGSNPPAIPAIQSLSVLASHFFVPNPITSTGLSPEFQMNSGEFFIGSKNASVPSTVPTYSVASVLLQNIQYRQAGGNLASWVVRTDVVGGVPPAELNSCTQGQTIAIPYKAHYLFFK